MKEDETPTEVTFRFIVNQVSKLKVPLQSPPCYMRNLSWRIEIHPPNMIDPQNETTKGSLGVYLHCSSKSRSWACYAVAEFRLLSVRPDVTPFTMTLESIFYPKEASSWGYPSFMPWTGLLNIDNGYIKDDFITLEVHIVEGNGIVKQLRDLEAKLEEEKKQKTVAIAAHKKLEGDLKKAEDQVEFLYKVVEDALKQLEKSKQYKEPTQGAEKSKKAIIKHASSIKDENRKGNTLEVELLQLTEDLASCTRDRPVTEAEHDKLQEEVTNRNNSALDNEKRRFEAKIALLEKKLEEEKGNNDFLLECQIKDLETDLSELDASHRSESKATITTLESKITNLEEQLLAEVKERLTQQNQSRKLDIKLKEFEIQLEKEKGNVHQYKEEVEKANGRVKAVKRRLEEAREENSKGKAQKRKVQRELDNVVESNKSMTGEIGILKSIISRNAGDTDLASSRIGTLKCGSLKPEEIGSRNDCTTQTRALRGSATTT